MKGALFLFVALCVLYVVNAVPAASDDDKVYGSVKYSSEVSDDTTRTPIYAVPGVTYPAPAYKGSFDELRKKLQEDNSQFRSIVRRDVSAEKIPDNEAVVPEGIIDPEERVIYSSPATPEYDENSEDNFPYQRVVVGVNRHMSNEREGSETIPPNTLPSRWIRHIEANDDSSHAATEAAATKDEEQEGFPIPPEWIIYSSPSAKSPESASYSSEEDEHSNSRSNNGRAVHFTTSLNIPSFPNGMNSLVPHLPNLPSASSLPNLPSFPNGLNSLLPNLPNLPSASSLPNLPSFSLPGASSVPSIDEVRNRGRDFINSIIQNKRIIPKTNFRHPLIGDSKCVHKLSLTGDDFVIDGHIYFTKNCQQPGDNGVNRPTTDNAWRPNLPGFNGSPAFPGMHLPAFPNGVMGYPTPSYPGMPRFPVMRPPYGGYMPGVKGMMPRPGVLPGFGNGHGLRGLPFGPGTLGFGRSLIGGEETHGTEVPTEEHGDNVTPTTAVHEEPNTQEKKSALNKSKDDQEKKPRERSIQIGPLKFGLGIGDRT